MNMFGRGNSNKRYDFIAAVHCLALTGCGSFYGLKGLKLNIAIAVIAGTDFALFGYDQGT